MNGSVILGLWPIAGITSGGVTERDSEQTIHAAMDCGIKCFDTAFSYGYDGESDRLLGRCIARRREHVEVIGKAGQRWSTDRQRVVDCSPAMLLQDAETSLRRLGIEQFDLFMLHSVDPKVDIRVSAEALVSIKEKGLTREIGVCNLTTDQLRSFCQVAKPYAIQHSMNLLQRDVLKDLVPLCVELGIQTHMYWVLMKGILAGRIDRRHQFPEGDSRPKYEIYQGSFRERTHRIVDQLAALARTEGLTVAQLSIGWALSQPGVSAALIGAKRPQQIRETARCRTLALETVAAIDAICLAEGVTVV